MLIAKPVSFFLQSPLSPVNRSSFLKISANGEMLAAGCLLLRSNFDRTATTHKLQINKHTTMKIEVIVSSHFPWRNPQR
jgi:hypothetical protein